MTTPTSTPVKHYVNLDEYSLYLSELVQGLRQELHRTNVVITSGLMQEGNAQSFKEYLELIQKEIVRHNHEYNRACYLEYHQAKLIEITDENSSSFYMWTQEKIKDKRTYN